MAVNNIFGASSIDDLADNVLSGVDDFMLTVEKMQKRKVASNVQLVVQALKKIESDLQDKYDGVTTVIEKRISTIKDGRDGINGRDGRDGKDGRPGKDGMPGMRGKDGAPGQDGADGMDGVSVTDARIDFDGSLIIVLSSGREINVGEVVTPDLAERIKVITNGGGTSQGVLDTLASLQAQINLLSSALVYAGTWNASTNTPTLASGVGTANTFYIVSVAGTTTLNGISNWGVGDWAIFNGTVWQRVEGGAEGNFTNLSVSGTTTLSGGTANGVMYLNGSKVVTTGSALAFDGTNLALGGSSPSTSSGYSKMRMNGSTGSLLELTSNGTQVLLIQADGAAAGAKIVTAFNGSSPPLILGVNNLTEVLLTNDGMGLGTGITAVTSGYKLDVQAAKALTLLKSTTGTNEVFHRINNTGGNFTLGIDSAGGAQTGTGYASYLWSTANTPLVLGTNNAAVATFSAAGNLTLNTGTFTYSAGTANGVAYLNGSKVLTTGSALTFDGNTLTVGAGAQTGYRLQSYVSSGNDGISILNGANGAGDFAALSFVHAGNQKAVMYTNSDNLTINASAGAAIFQIATTEAMRLTSTGLGIGTSSPALKLDVNGSAKFAGSYVSFNDNGYIRTDAANILRFQPGSGGYQFRNAGNSDNLAVLDSSGNLGIGTSSPGAKLDVNGGANSEMRLTTSGSGYLQIGQFTNGAFIGTSSTDPTAGILRLGTGGTTRATLDSSGNLGLGVTPSAWSQGRAIEMLNPGHGLWNGSGSPASTYVLANAYFNSGFKYGGTGQASHYYQYLGQHIWSTAASGTAGNAITFTQAMTLDASGNLALGKTSASFRADVEGDFRFGNLAVGTLNGYFGCANTGSITLNFGGTTTPNKGRIFYSDNSDLFAFYTNSTERARIGSNGKFCVNTTDTTGFPGFLLVQQATSADEAISVWNSATSGDNNLVKFYTDGGAGRGSITYNRAGGLVAYNTTSDYRAKDIIGPVANAGATIDALKVYEGQMKGATQSRPMLVAHEAQAVTPYAVTGDKDAVNDRGDPIFQQMDVSSLVPLLIAEIQSLRQRVAQLEGA
jgi:hypothetical protein